MSAYESTGERQYGNVFDQARETVGQSLATLAKLADGTAVSRQVADIRRDADQELSILDSLRQLPPDAASAAPGLNRARAATTSAIAAAGGAGRYSGAADCSRPAGAGSDA
ncbi:MAG: hypothetical protein WDO73_23075 [Ignavibacteriota bacterium]